MQACGRLPRRKLIVGRCWNGRALPSSSCYLLARKKNKHVRKIRSVIISNAYQSITRWHEIFLFWRCWWWVSSPPLRIRLRIRLIYVSGMVVLLIKFLFDLTRRPRDHHYDLHTLVFSVQEVLDDGGKLPSCAYFWDASKCLWSVPPFPALWPSVGLIVVCMWNDDMPQRDTTF